MSCDDLEARTKLVDIYVLNKNKNFINLLNNVLNSLEATNIKYLNFNKDHYKDCSENKNDQDHDLDDDQDSDISDNVYEEKKCTCKMRALKELSILKSLNKDIYFRLNFKKKFNLHLNKSTINKNIKNLLDNMTIEHQNMEEKLIDMYNIIMIIYNFHYEHEENYTILQNVFKINNKIYFVKVFTQDFSFLKFNLNIKKYKQDANTCEYVLMLFFTNNVNSDLYKEAFYLGLEEPRLTVKYINEMKIHLTDDIYFYILILEKND